MSSPSTQDIATLAARVAALEARLVALERVISIGAGGVTIGSPGTLEIRAGGGCTFVVAGALKATVREEAQLTLKKSLRLDVGKQFVVVASRDIELESGESVLAKSGSAKLELDKAGAASLIGDTLTLRERGRGLAIHGSRIGQN